MLPSLSHPESLPSSSSSSPSEHASHRSRSSTPHAPRATSAASACASARAAERVRLSDGLERAPRRARAAAELQQRTQHRSVVGDGLVGGSPQVVHAHARHAAADAHERAAPTQAEAGECAGLPADVGTRNAAAAAHGVADDQRAQQLARARRADARARRSRGRSAARSRRRGRAAQSSASRGRAAASRCSAPLNVSTAQLRQSSSPAESTAALVQRLKHAQQIPLTGSSRTAHSPVAPVLCRAPGGPHRGMGGGGPMRTSPS